jgi:outer membrane protein OmpA-like peptidoglycan-associated protein
VSLLRAFEFIAAAGAVLFLAASAAALGPEDRVPPDAQRQVAELSEQSAILSESAAGLGGASQDLSGGEQGLHRKEEGAGGGGAELAEDSDDFGGKSVRVTENEDEVKIEISSDVLFDFDRWGIRPDADSALTKVQEIISGYAGARITLEGHTDSIGSDQYNQNLSIKRAKSVKAWLVHRAGLDPRRMSAYGRGEQQPVAPNTLDDGRDNPEGRRRNRRVEIRVQKEG